jgi:cell division protein FtsZ
MTLNLTLPVSQHTDFSPRIAVIGVGGGGTNAVNNMISLGLEGVEFIVANTDAQSLVTSRAERRVQLGPHLTQGLGAGAKPEIGRAAAEEAMDELARHLDGCHMVFVTAGMGGGTGTGAAPVIARMARERGILTVGVVTRPFDFEGPKRKRAADQGLEELQSFVDTLIVVPNQNLFKLANDRTTFQEAFRMADNVLYMGVRGVTDLMVNPGLVNLDFADIRTVMAEMGKAMMGTGEAEGEDRAMKAAEAAISNPLLEDTSMRGARGVLINITGGHDMTLFEVDEAANRIRREVGENDGETNIIFGSSIDETMNGRIRVSVVATGIDIAAAAIAPQAQPRLAVVGGQRPMAAPAGAPRPAGTGGPLGAPVVPAPARRPVHAGGAGLLRQAVAPAAAPPVAQHQGYAEEPMPQPQPVMFEAPEPPQMAQAPALAPQPMPTPMAPPPAAATGGFGIRSLFRQATGAIRQPRPTTEQAPAPAARRAEPGLDLPRQSREVPQEDNRLDIPTFLRRQSN